VTAVTTLTPTAVWRISPELVLALDERLGPPVDGYVNGTQVWLTADGPAGATLEWRLHPVSRYRAPSDVAPDELWDAVVGAIHEAPGADALRLGRDHRALGDVWDGLECFPAYGDEVEPAVLAGAARDLLARAPDAAGLVDHGRIGDAWERARGATSIVLMLLEELEASG
jgi:hypothetical protein